MMTVFPANSDINMEISISKLTKNEALCVAEIEKECFSVPFKLDDILSYLENPIWNFFVAKDENSQILGYISFTVILDECQIVNAATSKKYRQNGVAKMLLRAVLDFAKETGCNKSFLEVRESNIPAIKLYEKFGYLQVGISKNHYSMPTENAILMNLDL